MYSVKEIFYTLQGEGGRSGRPAVFLRFSGCNLWSGLEKDRSTAICNFCDTDFVGTDGHRGGKFPKPETLASAVSDCWPKVDDVRAIPYVVCTGGEPLLQLDVPLIKALKEKGFEVAVETNGTIKAPSGIDWITVSPKKARETLIQKSGDELKLIYPQNTPKMQPECFEDLDFNHFYLQAMDSASKEKNIEATLNYCFQHPRWNLSIQSHKILNIA